MPARSRGPFRRTGPRKAEPAPAPLHRGAHGEKAAPAVTLILSGAAWRVEVTLPAVRACTQDKPWTRAPAACEEPVRPWHDEEHRNQGTPGGTRARPGDRPASGSAARRRIAADRHLLSCPPGPAQVAAGIDRILDRTRIHLDAVDGLGFFLELEVAVGDEDDAAERTSLARRCLEEFGLREADLVRGAYADLLESDRA